MQIVEAHGARIPALGFGTWTLRDEACVEAVAAALGIGYRHVDTAVSYGNEKAVGEGIRASGVPRDDIFLTTKVRPDDFEERAFFASVERSLSLLAVDRLDLVLLHWPSRTLPTATIIATLNAVKRRGLARHIGVSNFTSSLLDEAWAATEEPLVTNQCEYHPYLNQDVLRAACFKHGMSFTAYAPLGRQKVLEDPTIVAIAEKTGRTPAQVVLRWEVQQQATIVIPKSATPEHIRANAAIFDFRLGDEDMAAISALSRTHKLRVTSPAGLAPDWDTK